MQLPLLRPQSLLSEPPDIPERPTSASIREHLQNILDDSRTIEDVAMRPNPPLRNKKSPDDSHVSALIQVHEEFIKQGEERPLRDETFQCAACERRMKLQDSWMSDKEEANNTWPRRQPLHAYDFTKQHSYDENGQADCTPSEFDRHRDIIVHCEYCGHDGVPVHVVSEEDDDIQRSTPPDQFLGSQQSLMSISDSCLVLHAPPPTPSSPTAGSGKSLAHSLNLASEHALTINNNNESPPSSLVKVPGTLEALADSVSATAEVLHQSSNSNNNQTPSQTKASADCTLESLEDTASSRMDTGTTTADNDDEDDVFLRDGFALESRNSDYADLFQEEIEKEKSPKKSESKYQSLTTFNTTVVLGKDDDDYDEPPDDFFTLENPEESTKSETKVAGKGNLTPPPPPLHKMPSWVSTYHNDGGQSYSSPKNGATCVLGNQKKVSGFCLLVQHLKPARWLF